MSEQEQEPKVSAYSEEQCAFYLNEAHVIIAPVEQKRGPLTPTELDFLLSLALWHVVPSLPDDSVSVHS